MNALFEFSYTPYILPLILAGVLIAVVMAATWRFRATQLGRAFLRLLLSLQIWTLGFAVELAAVHLAGKLFWANIQFVGILLLPMSWLEITLLSTGRSRNIKRYMTLLSMLVVLMLVVIWTNDFHRFFRNNPHIDCAENSFCFLVNDYGTLFYFYAAISYALFLTSLVVMAESLTMTKPIYRQQSLLLLASLILPLTTDLLYTLGLSPIPHFNFTAMTFSVGTILMGVALFRFRLVSIRPLAYDMIIENLRDGILILDKDNIIVDINPAAQTLLGVSGSQAIGESVLILYKKMPELVEQFWNISSIKSVVQVGGEGDERRFDVTISPINDRSGNPSGRAVTIHDMTEQFKLYQKVERLAQTDPLTGLFNRRYFFECSEQEVALSLRDKKSLSLLMLDLDNFKRVNDTHGHTTGDYVLAEVASVLKSNLRRNDMAGRYGGEEFIILLPEIDSAAAREVAERLRETIATQPMQTGEDKVWVTISVGIATLRHKDGEALTSLIHAADTALYRAKALGKNRVEG